MVELYATLIINKRKTIDQVPVNLMKDVKTSLSRQGYDENGDPIKA